MRYNDTIITKDLPNLNNIELKFKNTKYPQCKDINLPRLFFVALFVGSRGSGKTYSCSKLLKMYEHFGIFSKHIEVYQRIILI